jgi:hypothetical protein
MNYLNFMDNKTIVVSNHAKNRALQRARLFLMSHEKDDLAKFLRSDFKTGKIDTKIINCPFYQNKYQTTYGENSFRVKSKLFDYRGRVIDDVIYINTVIFIGRK